MSDTTAGMRKRISNGYIEVYAPEHPNAHKTGFVYEHRYIMSKILGRPLLPTEIVHHDNKIKKDNEPGNLKLKTSKKQHKAEHKSLDSRIQNPDEPNILISCKCGCGLQFLKYDKHGRPREFSPGHWRKGKLTYDPKETVQCACGCGKNITKYDKYGRPRKYISGHNAYPSVL